MKPAALPVPCSMQRSRQRGFSLTELVVVAGLAAVVFSTAALAFRTITVHQKRSTAYQEVIVGPAISKAFYDNPTGKLDVYTTPNYGMTARAEIMRNEFWNDVAHASAVYCLPRPRITVSVTSDVADKVRGVNYLHPLTLDVTPASGVAPFAGTSIDHPNAFRQLLLAASPVDSAANPFPFTNDYRGVPAANDVNGSVFIMQMSNTENALTVRAVYDIDFLDIADPAQSTYASVKRFVGNTLTHFYDVLFSGPGADQTPPNFGPTFACFERSVRRAYPESGGIAAQANAFKRAGDRPFYYIWWPDPATPRLAGIPTTTAYTASDARSYYSKHENQTSWLFTVPMFPPL
jgi:prepilin-type N-terminal cleavage/methylation domain-containing protein